MSRKSVWKGKKGEKRTADLFRKTLEGCDKVEVIQRNQGKWSGKHNPEIAIVMRGDYNDHLVHIENKRDKRASLLAAYKQAERDAMHGAIPIAVCKRDSEPEIVAITNMDLTKFIKSYPDAVRIYQCIRVNLRFAFLRAVRESRSEMIPVGISWKGNRFIGALWLSDFLPMVRAWAKEL